MFLTPETCKDGESRPSEDGCNTCICNQGSWGCTEVACISRETLKLNKRGEDISSKNYLKFIIISLVNFFL